VKTPVVTPVPPTSFPDSAGDNIPGQGAEKIARRGLGMPLHQPAELPKKTRNLATLRLSESMEYK